MLKSVQFKVRIEVNALCHTTKPLLQLKSSEAHWRIYGTIQYACAHYQINSLRSGRLTVKS